MLRVVVAVNVTAYRRDIERVGATIDVTFVESEVSPPMPTIVAVTTAADGCVECSFRPRVVARLWWPSPPTLANFELLSRRATNYLSADVTSFIAIS